MKLRICKKCENQILNGNYKYCSDECKPSKYKLKISITEICLECGEKLIKKEQCGRKRLYCPTRCRDIADHKRRKELKCIRKKSYIKICSQCGIEFKTYHQNQRYCNPVCDKTSRRTLIGFIHNCTICGEEYEKSYKEQKCCSLKCAGIKRGNTRRVYPDKLKHRRIVEAIRRKTDLPFALNNRMRILMYSSLRQVKNGHKWQDLAGYSVDDLRRHIEKQFKDGMSWERFLAGEIHIDHKIPVSAFSFSKPEHMDFKRCWALKNLQPMWAEENISKGNKLL